MRVHRRGGCRASRLRRRYGCFRLPDVPGARVVKEAKRRDVSWLARTDPDRREVEFSEHWNRLGPIEKQYIALHEQAHIETGPDHNLHFYDVLMRLTQQAGIPWKVAYKMESFNCHAKH